jgi:hypothetical protein
VTFAVAATFASDVVMAVAVVFWVIVSTCVDDALGSSVAEPE